MKSIKVINKFCYPTIMFVVFLTVADKYVVFVIWDET